MLNTTSPIHYTDKNHQPVMINFINKISQLFAKMMRLHKPARNEFHNRYPEKFVNPDHCQWQGGRLLSQQELKDLPTK